MCMCCRFVMQAHMSLCKFCQMQPVAEYDCRSKEGATLHAYINCKRIRCMTLRRFLYSVCHVAMLMLFDFWCNAWYSDVVLSLELDRHDMHLIHHVIVVAVGAACDNLDGIGPVICFACRLHHSSKCPTANTRQLSICSRTSHHKQPMCAVMCWTDSIALHARSCNLLDWLHAMMTMHMMSPLYTPPG